MTAAPFRTLLLLTLPLAAILALGCFPRSPSSVATLSPTAPPSVSEKQPAPLFLARTEEEAKPYVGDDACAPCHSDIAKTHRLSDHATSLRRVTSADFGSLFQTNQTIHDPFADTAYHPVVQNSTCAITSQGPAGKQTVTARFALGSMHNGQTYLGQDDARNWYVMRLSYYTHIHRWDFTPQQEPMITVFAQPEGQKINQKEVADCLTCHATTLQTSEDGIDDRHSHFGVGCESCHGPGAAHIAAIDKSAGQDVGMIEDLKKAPVSRIMEICAGCHSTPLYSEALRPEQAEGLIRFAATALAQSKCYRNSDSLSCVTCHDPHTNLTTNPTLYEKTCLRCHSNNPPEAPQDTTHQTSRTSHPTSLCPVNPRSGCIGCHMPAQEDAKFPHMAHHNHWIRVWRQAATSK